jgi:hypothetical protein
MLCEVLYCSLCLVKLCHALSIPLVEAYKADVAQQCLLAGSVRMRLGDQLSQEATTSAVHDCD